MSGKSSIEWTDTTWNPIRGCSLVSAGCANCYAMRQAHRFAGSGQPYEGLTKLTEHGPVWTGKVRLVPELLDQPLRWKKPRRVFVNSMSDLFHEDIPDDFIAKVFLAMLTAKQHTFQVLTKRPQRMLELLEKPRSAFPLAMMVGDTLPNVWLGVSVEDQKTADERIPLLLQTPAAVRWVSAEPLLGPVDLAPHLERMTWDDMIAHQQETEHDDCESVALDWVVVGGESGPGARPMDVAWARSIVDQCRTAKVPVFVKQLGAHVLGVEDDRFQSMGDTDLGWRAHLNDRKGGDWMEWPHDLRMREYPTRGP